MLILELIEVWEESEDDLNEDNTEPEFINQDTSFSSSLHPRAMCMAKWIVAFISFAQAMYQLSDTVAQIFVKFLKVLFHTLGSFSSLCLDIASCLPESLYMLHKMNGSLNLGFIRYVVCRKCHNIYRLNKCINEESKKCRFVSFPRHPQIRLRQPCDTMLLKTVELASGKIIHYPFLTYCYMGLETSLQKLLLRKGFFQLSELWRNRVVSDCELKDVYDGRVWKEFINYKGTPFFSKPLSLGLMINVDWFQPYKHVQYSVGAIYISILNLPRCERNKTNNVILIGLMPGPHEPSCNMNSYITPLVEELSVLWHGKEMSVHGFTSKQLVRCVLICAACDLPAGRKLCGFLSFSANFGCTRCWKKFPGGVADKDFSGFDRENWLIRNEEEHRNTATKLQSCNTKAQRHQIESNSGYRYTALLKLPYFNPSRMLILDPMHNLFLGTAKHFLKSVWIGGNKLSTENLELIQSRINKVKVPSDLGRIPYKIASGFSSFTADQFKNWVIYYSLLTIRDILDNEDIECWCHFVLTCRLLCSRGITLEQLKLADALLMQFCKRTERMYGKDVITPNMHLHSHLRECILDYGPIHGFWLFSFERFNGILGQQPNNNRSIEVQLMRRFLRDNMDLSITLPDLFNEEFSQVFHNRKLVGTLSDSMDSSPCMPLEEIENTRDWCMESGNINVNFPSHYSKAIFNAEEKDGLIKLYSKLYSVQSSVIKLPSSYMKYRDLTLNGKVLGSCNSRSKNSSVVMCNASLFSHNPARTKALSRPIRINFFAKHKVCIDQKLLTHVLVSASWFKVHSKQLSFSSPVTVWECDLFDEVCSFIPAQCIKSRTVSLVDSFDEASGQALFVIPIIDY